MPSITNFMIMDANKELERLAMPFGDKSPLKVDYVVITSNKNRQEIVIPFDKLTETEIKQHYRILADSVPKSTVFKGFHFRYKTKKTFSNGTAKQRYTELCLVRLNCLFLLPNFIWQ